MSQPGVYFGYETGRFQTACKFSIRLSLLEINWSLFISAQGARDGVMDGLVSSQFFFTSYAQKLFSKKFTSIPKGDQPIQRKEDSFLFKSLPEAVMMS